MKIIDTHLHLWDVGRLAYPWLATVPPIHRTFRIADYQEAAASYDIDRLVFVQAECRPEQNWQEIAFADEQAGQDARIRGMVAYLPLEKGASLAGEMAEMQAHPHIKGVRRMTGYEPGLCLTPGFVEAVRMLPRYGLSLDLSIKPFQMAETIRLIQKCPDTLFILDHLGKPAIKAGGLGAFQKDMAALAALPNVVAKLSGLITEADWAGWRPDELKPYICHAVDTFGPGRLLYGSDWPVLLLAGRLGQWLDTLQHLLAGCTAQELNQVFYSNALRVYRLTP